MEQYSEISKSLLNREGQVLASRRIHNLCHRVATARPTQPKAHGTEDPIGEKFPSLQGGTGRPAGQPATTPAADLQLNWRGAVVR